MTKQSRKELLKHDDAFIVAAGQATTWFTQHRNAVLGAVGALFVVAIATLGVTAYGNSKSKEASRYFAEGWRATEGRTKQPEHKGSEHKDAKAAEGKVPAKGTTVATKDQDTTGKTAEKPADANGKVKDDEPGEDEDEDAEDDRPLFATAKEKWATARTAFEKAEDVAGHKGVGVMAALMVGDLSDKLGEHDKAEQVFSGLRQEVPGKDSLSFLAVERFAYARESAGDVDGALDALKDLAGDEQRFYADYAQMHQARLYLAKGDRDRARAMLEHIQTAFPESSLQEEVKTKIAELGGAEGMAQLGSGTTPVDTNGRVGQ